MKHHGGTERPGEGIGIVWYGSASEVCCVLSNPRFQRKLDRRGRPSHRYSGSAVEHPCAFLYLDQSSRGGTQLRPPQPRQGQEILSWMYLLKVTSYYSKCTVRSRAFFSHCCSFSTAHHNFCGEKTVRSVLEIQGHKSAMLRGEKSVLRKKGPARAGRCSPILRMGGPAYFARPMASRSRGRAGPG